MNEMSSCRAKLPTKLGDSSVVYDSVVGMGMRFLFGMDVAFLHLETGQADFGRIERFLTRAGMEIDVRRFGRGDL